MEEKIRRKCDLFFIEIFSGLLDAFLHVAMTTEGCVALFEDRHLLGSRHSWATDEAVICTAIYRRFFFKTTQAPWTKLFRRDEKVFRKFIFRAMFFVFC